MAANSIERLIEKTIGNEPLKQYQVRKINDMIEYCRENSHMYKSRLEGIKPLKSLEDISGLPFTTPDDLRNTPYEMLCVSVSGVARTYSHFTTGTLGEPKKIFFSQYDVDRIEESMSSITEMVIEEAGLATENTKVAIYLPNVGRPLSMAEMIAAGCEKIGAVPFIGACKITAEEQVHEIERERPDIVMGSAFRIWRMTQVGRSMMDLRSLGVSTLFITSEYLSTTMRRHMEEAWGAEVYHHYGMTEPGFAIAVECAQHNGFHYNESDLYFEVVEPETGEAVPDGEEGELVFTSLDRTAQPFIRYRTGDIASITAEKCSCGSYIHRIGTLHKKIGMIHKLKNGREVYSALFDEALYEIPDIIDYRIWIEEAGGKDRLRVAVEFLPDRNDEGAVVRQLMTVPAVRSAMEEGLMEEPHVELAPPEGLRRGGRGMKRKIVDERSGFDPSKVGIDLQN